MSVNVSTTVSVYWSVEELFVNIIKVLISFRFRIETGVSSSPGVPMSTEVIPFSDPFLSVFELSIP